MFVCMYLCVLLTCRLYRCGAAARACWRQWRYTLRGAAGLLVPAAVCLPPTRRPLPPRPSPPRPSLQLDVWSAGVIFYTLLYGRKPYGESMSQEQMLRERVMCVPKGVDFPPKPQVSAWEQERAERVGAYRYGMEAACRSALHGPGSMRLMTLCRCGCHRPAAGATGAPRRTAPVWPAHWRGMQRVSAPVGLWVWAAGQVPRPQPGTAQCSAAETLLQRPHCDVPPNCHRSHTCRCRCRCRSHTCRCRCLCRLHTCRCRSPAYRCRQVSAEAKDFIRRCLAWQQEARWDVETASADAYLCPPPAAPKA